MRAEKTPSTSEDERGLIDRRLFGGEIDETTKRVLISRFIGARRRLIGPRAGEKETKEAADAGRFG